MSEVERDDDPDVRRVKTLASAGLRAEILPADDSGALLYRVHGDVDLAGAEGLLSGLTEALAAKPARLVVDLADVEFFDSSGLNLLLRIRLDAEAAGVPLALASPSAAVVLVLDVTGAGALFTVEAAA